MNGTNPTPPAGQTPAPGPTDNETAFGFAEVLITYKTGATETVKVHQLEVDDYPELLKHIDDERRSIELYCKQPKGWALTLSLKGHTAAIEAGERLNVDFFERWVRRRRNRYEMVAPGALEKAVAEADKKPDPKASPFT